MTGNGGRWCYHCLSNIFSLPWSSPSDIWAVKDAWEETGSLWVCFGSFSSSAIHCALILSQARVMPYFAKKYYFWWSLHRGGRKARVFFQSFTRLQWPDEGQSQYSNITCLCLCFLQWKGFVLLRKVKIKRGNTFVWVFFDIEQSLKATLNKNANKWHC